MTAKQLQELEQKLEQAHLDEEKAMHIRLSQKLAQNPKPLSVESRLTEDQLNENLLSDTVKHSLRNDPCLSYGAGIVTYYRMQRKLIRLFCVLALLASVQMIIFWLFGGLDHMSNADVGVYARTSFGNIGFSKVVCFKQTIDFSRGPWIDVNFQCEKTTSVTGVVSSGVMLSNSLPGGTDSTTTTCHTEQLQSGSLSEGLNKDYFD